MSILDPLKDPVADIHAIEEPQAPKDLQVFNNLQAPPDAPPEIQTFLLPCGRTLSYAEQGSPNGTPIFYFHGTPGSCLDSSFSPEAIQKYNVRIISVDRPGYGRSSLQKNRKILDWPMDVEQLARCLQLSEYRVLGWSGGAPSALACAARLPRERLKGVGIECGVGPDYVQFSTTTRSRARLNLFMVARLLMRPTTWILDLLLRKVTRYTNDEIKKMRLLEFPNYIKRPDRTLLSFIKKRWCPDPEDSESSYPDIFPEGFRGFLIDCWLIASPWGFNLEDISFDTVKMWYGTEDDKTPVSMGRRMAEKLQHATLTEHGGKSHRDLIAKYQDEILLELLCSEKLAV